MWKTEEVGFVDRTVTYFLIKEGTKNLSKSDHGVWSRE